MRISRLFALMGITLVLGCEPAVTETYVVPFDSTAPPVSHDDGDDDITPDDDDDGFNPIVTEDDDDDDNDDSTGTTIWCLDADDDGYGDGSDTVTATYTSNGYVADCSDCNDDSASVHPGASDTTADGVDQDCNGTDATTSTEVTWYADSDGDAYGNVSVSKKASTQPSGYVSNYADCDDTNANVNPGKTEVAGNGLNDDCYSGTSDTAASMWYKDTDGDGYGNASSSTSYTTQPSGYVSNDDDCDDSSAAVSPADVEVTGNGKDDDCNPATSDTASTSLVREVCVVSSTSDYKLAYYDEGTSDRTHWVTEVSSTATVVSPILTGSSGSTGCVSITLTKSGTMVCFNGAGTASRLWGDYLVGANPGSGTFAYSNSSTASEVKLTIDGTVNGSSDSSAEAVTFDGNDLCWTD